MSMIDVSISVDGASRDVFDRILQHLVAAGLMNVTTSKRLGLANGSIDGLGMSALRGIEGVASVRAAASGGTVLQSRGGTEAGPGPARKPMPPIELPRSGETIMVI
jgi:hypothetical protein